MKFTRIDNVIARQKKSTRLDFLMVTLAVVAMGFGISSLPFVI